MAGLLALSRLIDSISIAIGKSVMWLVLVAVLVSAYNAIVRYLGDALGSLPIPRASNSLLELQWYLYGAVFLLAAAYTLQRNEHIRIDIVSSRLSKRTRDWIDLVCHVFFLLPFTVLLVFLSWPWLVRSFNSGEVSTNAGGLIIWPAKALLFAGFALLTAQAISEIIKRIGVIRGDIVEPSAQHEVSPAAEGAIEMGKPARD